MNVFLAKFKQYVLPLAILLGFLLHDFCADVKGLVPVLIFTILLLSFVAVDIRRLRPTLFDLGLLVYQVVVGVGIYLAITLLGGDKIIAEGVMMGALTPVAASSTVVACMLGANRERVTTFALVGNLSMALVLPVVFTLIGDHPEYTLGTSYMLMLAKIGSVLALPFFIALALQIGLPKANEALARRTSWSYYVWAVALFLTLGQTIHYIIKSGDGHWNAILWLSGLSLLFCAFQFWLGRKYGKRFDDIIGGAQMMGQKNSAMGIWMINTFLYSPLSSVFMAFYSVWQNLWNAIQIAMREREMKSREARRDD